MSDFAKERRQRARAGSLLDHAGSAPAAAARRPGQGEPARQTPQPSLLAATPRATPRIATNRFATASSAAADMAGPARFDHTARGPSAKARPLLDHAAANRSAEAHPGPDRDTGSREVPGSDDGNGRVPRPPREAFGDRISRLVGRIAPSPGGSVHPPRAHDDQPGRATAPDARAREPGGSAETLHRSWPADAREPGQWNAAASATGWAEPDSRPLLDPSILMAAVWRFRTLIALTTLLGAVIGVMMALSTPHKYYAESRLFVDPREVRVTEDDVRNQQLSTEAMLAIIDSQLQILSSTGVLQKVIDDLGLERDPEFNGSLSSGGLGAGIDLITEIFTGKDPASDAAQKALEELRDSLSVSRDSKTFVIIVGVDTRDPEKSALIANTIVETYLDSEGAAQSGLLERTSESINTRINALREDLDEAEREVERFKAENGIVGVGGQNIDDKEILAISEQLANARAVKVGVRVKAQNLAKANPEDVLTGAFPEEFLSSNLLDLRKQYTQTKSTADALATRLGPRHPQFVSAKSSLDSIRSEIVAELRRIVASSQLELQRAVETEQELASQMAVAKSRAMDQSVEFVTLRELERKAAATRQIYEAFLKRSRETSERSNLSTRNIRVISPAEPPLQPDGPSRKIIAVGGMVTGFFAGLGLALLVGAAESIRSYNGFARGGRYAAPPSGPPPMDPDPGPRTPPQGPGSAARSAAQADQGAAAVPRHGAPAATAPYTARAVAPGNQTNHDVAAPAQPDRADALAATVPDTVAAHAGPSGAPLSRPPAGPELVGQHAPASTARPQAAGPAMAPDQAAHHAPWQATPSASPYVDPYRTPFGAHPAMMHRDAVGHPASAAPAAFAAQAPHAAAPLPQQFHVPPQPAPVPPVALQHPYQAQPGVAAPQPLFQQPYQPHAQPPVPYPYIPQPHPFAHPAHPAVPVYPAAPHLGGEPVIPVGAGYPQPVAHPAHPGPATSPQAVPPQQARHDPDPATPAHQPAPESDRVVRDATEHEAAASTGHQSGAVDRIRRDMEALKSRIGGLHGARRRA